MKLEKGAKAKVRLHTGEVVEAEYEERASVGAHHWVLHKGKALQTVGLTVHLDKGNYFERCRFVGNPCVLMPVGVSV